MARTSHALPRMLVFLGIATLVVLAATAPTAQAAARHADRWIDWSGYVGDAIDADAWSGAGAGWNGGSWRDQGTTWTPAQAATVQVRDLSVDRPAISPNGDGSGDDVAISLRLRRTSADVRVLVRDEAGATIRDLGAVTSATRVATLTWDGLSDAGATVPDGTYRIAIVADADVTGASTASETLDVTVDVDTTAPSVTATRPSLSQLRALASRAATVRDAKARWARAAARHGHRGDWYRRTRSGRHGNRSWSDREQQWVELWQAQQLRLPMTMTLEEAGTVEITTQVGSKRSSMVTWRDTGRHTVDVALPTYTAAAKATVTFDMQDDAGNVRRHTVVLLLPALPAPAPTRRETTRDETPSPSNPAPVTNVPTNTNGPLPDWLDPIMQRATYGAGVPLSWASSRALYNIISHESSFRPTAQNPTSTAYGMFQFLNTTWATVGCVKTSDAYQQSVCGLRYIQRRYHTPEQAWAFWQAHNWY